jgi:hypothetical protein
MPGTTQNILWYDDESNKVKIAKHARLFDEGMNDLSPESIPPNVQLLERVRQGEKVPIDDEETEIPQFEFRINPFEEIISKNVLVQCNSPTLGVVIGNDAIYNRAYISSIRDKSSVSKIFSTHCATNNRLRGSYIVSVNGNPTFTADDVTSALALAKNAGLQSIPIEFAPEKKLTARGLQQALVEHDIHITDPDVDDEHIAALSIEDIRSIATLRHPSIDFSPESISSELLHYQLNAIQSDAITAEEQAIGSFTRRKLKKLKTWPDWQQGEFQQLDHFHSLNMYGKPVPRPKGAIVLLRPHWQYQIKRDGTRRSRNCCDGSSPRSAPTLHAVSSTYSSCVEQPIQRLFFALAAQMGYNTYGGDAQDAYAHSPPPEHPTFMQIDDAYAEWYAHRFGIHLDRDHVLPVQHALQGHPESGRLWEEHINRILLGPKLKFTTTTHDRTIYRTVYKGHKILLLRQVDDFAIASPSETIATEIYDIIGSALQLPTENSKPFKYLGLLTDFNGLDIHHTRDHISVSCERYVQRLLRSHNWETPSKNEAGDTEHNAIPLPVDAINHIYSVTGPLEQTDEHAQLSKQHGFNYRTLLGELLYAYVTCRPADIGYAVTTLSKFATCPAPIHYTYLRGVAKYLRRTIHWKIRYNRSCPDMTFPIDTMTQLDHDPSLPSLPDNSSTQLICYVDAAHANDLRNRRSTMGYCFTLSGGAIVYKSKTQSITATSSTEAEFIAAVSAAKTAKYLRAILVELGFPQPQPTPIYCDNMSAIKIINAKVPSN